MSQGLVKHILQQHSIAHFGFTKLERPLSIDVYKNWIADGLHADMKYLVDHTEQKEQPQKLLEKAQSAIVITVPYPQPESDFPLRATRVAKYAKGTDYHYWLKNTVQCVANDLQNLFPTEQFVCFTDSSPVLERDLAYSAGLGWFGKNSCLISRAQGSYFLIAEIYTTLDLQQFSPPSPDHCGTCNRCVEACPTGAILDNRTLDATKCISFWTIESKTVPSPQLAQNFSDWFFGCDICQDVCPWNGKVYGSTYKQPEPSRRDFINEMKWILTSSNKELERTFKHTPLLRARGRGLKRNAMIVIANTKTSELTDLVQDYSDHPELGGTAKWCLDILNSQPKH